MDHHLDSSSSERLHVFAVGQRLCLEPVISAAGGCPLNFLPTAFLRHDSSSTLGIRHGRRRCRRRPFLPRASATALLLQSAAGCLSRHIQPPKGRLRLVLRPPVAVPPLGPPAGCCDGLDPAANFAPPVGGEGELRLLLWR